MIKESYYYYYYFTAIINFFWKEAVEHSSTYVSI